MMSNHIIIDKQNYIRKFEMIKIITDNLSSLRKWKIKDNYFKKIMINFNKIKINLKKFEIK